MCEHSEGLLALLLNPAHWGFEIISGAIMGAAWWSAKWAWTYFRKSRTCELSHPHAVESDGHRRVA